MIDETPSDEKEIDGLIDFSGSPRSMGPQRDYAFKLMQNRMMEVIHSQMAHVQPLMKKTALHWYERGLNDAFKVFAQVTEQNVDDELSPG